MEKKEYIDRINELKDKIGLWDVELNEYTKADFVIGYYYNENTQEYTVYINKERGRHRVRKITKNENEALEKLVSMLEYEAESNRYSW